MDKAKAMPPTTAKPQSRYSAAFEGTHLTEQEIEEVINYFARQAAEDELRDYFTWRLRKPLGRIGWRLKKLNDRAARIARYGR